MLTGLQEINSRGKMKDVLTFPPPPEKYDIKKTSSIKIPPNSSMMSTKSTQRLLRYESEVAEN